MKILLFAGIMTFAAINSLMAQNLVQGKVIDKVNGDALQGVNVRVEGNTTGAVTDESGNFTLNLEKDYPVVLLFSFAGYIQERYKVTDSQYIEITLDTDFRLEEVIIRATRADETAPFTHSTVQKKALREIYRGQDANFLLEKLTPSIIAYTESGTAFSNYSQMRLRGIDQSRINITLNGVPLNDMIDQGVFFSNFTDFGNSIETVQVQRGVGTSSHGTSSFAGSINFESIHLQDSEPGSELQLTAGSFGSYRASVEANTGIQKNKTAFYTRLSRIYSDGFRDNTNTDSWSMMFSGAYFGDKDIIKFTAFTGKSNNGLAYLPVAESDIRANPRTNYLNENDRDAFRQHMAQLQYTRLLNSRLTFHNTAYYGGAGGDFLFSYPALYNIVTEDGSIVEQERLEQINYPLTNHHFGYFSTLHFSEGSTFQMDAGLHLYTFRRNNQEQFMPDKANPYYNERSNKDEISVFTKAEYQVGKIRFYGDLSYRSVLLQIVPDDSYLGFETVNIRNTWSFFNPKAGLTWQIQPKNELYASIGRSGREPTKIDLLGGFQVNPVNYSLIRQGDVILPEFVNNLEAGYRYRSEKIGFEGNLFYMQFENEIAPIGRFVEEGFIQLRKNMPSSFRAGIELDAHYQILPGLRFNGNLTYMTSRIDEYAPDDEAIVYNNVKPALTPDWLVNAALSWEPLKALKITMSSRYMGESFLDPSNRSDLILPSFMVFDSQIEYTYKNARLNVQMLNLGNRLYYTYGAPVFSAESNDFVAGYFIQPPRNAFINLILNF
ncbi:MAG: TonB-dependent receptor [Cyclobacteriaceae bacterium]|nr:TonB-dependent receptor [Cyclobacteriaceae bacterium]